MQGIRVEFPANDDHFRTKIDFYKTKSMLYDRSWVVHAKEAFSGPELVMEYLVRYIHKIAISNHRILKVTATHVYFKYLNRDKNKSEIQRVTGERFVKLFLQHVLPFRFIKIRHYGFLSSRSKKVDLFKIRQVLNVTEAPSKSLLTIRELLIKTYGKDPNLCPK